MARISSKDVLTAEQRRLCMQRIRGKDTKPELLIRKGLFQIGFRYKVCDKSLAGKPDLVFPKYSSVIFIHGCFWHGHNCPMFKWPVKNAEFWKQKIGRNIINDRRNCRELRDEGWYILTIWECAIRGPDRQPVETVIFETASWLEQSTRNRTIQGRKVREPSTERRPVE